MNIISSNQMGWIEVISGSMFSGKSEELIRRLRRAEIARLRVQVFKPKIDDRYSKEEIVSHSQLKMKSELVGDAAQLQEKVNPRTDVVGIDEAQFFDARLVDVCNELADGGKRVIVAGLDKDYLGVPFEPMPNLLATAEFITKIYAICVVCGNPAHYSQRIVDSKDRVVVGATGVYEPRCRKHFEPIHVPVPKKKEPAGIR